MREVFGNMWEYSKSGVDAVCIFTNMEVHKSRLIMGAGMAAEAAELFPILPHLWGEEYTKRKQIGAKEALVIWDPILSAPAVVSFPTKYRPSERSDMGLIMQAATELADAAAFRDWKDILLGRPGCGLGGLSWEEQVRPTLVNMFDDRFIVITNDAG